MKKQIEKGCHTKYMKYENSGCEWESKELYWTSRINQLSKVSTQVTNESSRRYFHSLNDDGGPWTSPTASAMCQSKFMQRTMKQRLAWYLSTIKNSNTIVYVLLGHYVVVWVVSFICFYFIIFYVLMSYCEQPLTLMKCISNENIQHSILFM